MIKKTSILINAANLHNGGAIQVALSFLNELKNLDTSKYSLLVSSSIHKELLGLNFPSQKFNSYVVHDAIGIYSLFDIKYQQFLQKYFKVFTIFGPIYSWFRINNSISGFAQPWIIYPNNELNKSYSIYLKLFLKIKFKLQWFFFKRNEILVVELNHVQDRLIELYNFSNTYVVNNCVSSIFFNKKYWEEIKFKRPDFDIVIGVPSRDYPHKNLDILPEVSEILSNFYKMSLKFVVTLNEKEWNLKSRKFRQTVANAGPLLVIQCPHFYKMLDGVILPSLLECFSATPIEAISLSKPVFVSDKLFNRQSCEEHAVYFNPQDSADIAQKIFQYYNLDLDIRMKKLDQAFSFSKKFCNPSDRAINYVKIIDSI